MKKITLLTVFIYCGLLVSAQRKSLSDATLYGAVHQEVMRIIPAHNTFQSPPFFSEDFASGIPGSWTNVDHTGNNVLWRYTTTGALNQAVPVASQLNQSGTSAANGYVILDSDSAGAAFTENTDLTTVAINCSGHPNVHLSFNEYFAQFGASTGIVEVSNDNVTWVDVHHAETGLAGDSGTANPYLIDVDISATAGNQATVYIRFNYVGAFDYWWMLDDIQLYEPTATDLAANSIKQLSDEYTKIPLSQATALTISSEIKNVGVNATAGGTALLELVDVGSGLTVFNETVNLSALSPGSTQTVMPSSAFAPPVAGMYKSRVTITLAGDGNAANDTMESDPLFVSDSIYQRDDEVFQGVQPIGFGVGEDGMAGQSFTINTAGDLTSITFFLKDTFSFGVLGTPLFFTVHPQLNSSTAPDGTILLATSDTLMLVDGMIPAGGAYYTLHIHGGAVNLNPGLYFIGFHEVDVPIPMGYSDNVFSAGAVWAFANSINWFKPEDFGFYLSYMIRANMGMLPDAVSDKTLIDDVLLFPNPSSGIFMIRTSKANRHCHLRVIDAIGKEVYSSFISGLLDQRLDLSKLAEGIYTLSIRGDSYAAMRKIFIAGK